MDKKNKMPLVGKIIIYAIVLITIFFAYQLYQKTNFNDFIKYETKVNTSEFVRDNDEKYNNERSYKINSPEYNDAMFAKKIKINKNTPYKVTCMVKTKNVQSNAQKVGAQISVQGTTEMSNSITGTQDWQKLELIFNSKNREELEIGFRLGGNLGESIGEAWFSNFSIEEGKRSEDSNWKFACIILKNTNVNINNKKININITENEIQDIRNTIKRFENCCQDISKGKMTATCDVFENDKPITELSYDENHGYYVSTENIEEQIKEVTDKDEYDHIFAIVKLGDEYHQNDIKINDWIGLGSMSYYEMGFSNIRLPNNSNSYIYRYNTRVNLFPEEVFLHEFLHSLEKNAIQYGFEIPELHDYEKYGYREEALIGQKRWYEDYMNKNINSTSGKIGLPSEIYKLKPTKNSEFRYSYKIDEFKQPQNIIEEIQEIIRKVINKFKK